MYKLGLFKSPYDERDYLLRSFLPKAVELPSQFDLTYKMTPVRDQGNEGSCVGFAMVVGVKEYEEQLQYKRYVELSPRFLYENAKAIDAIPGTNHEGTTLKAAVSVAINKGVCEEMFWPYIAKNPGTPKEGAYENAKIYKINTYARVMNIDELKQAIFDPKCGAVLIGIKVYKGMVSEEAKNTGVCPDPTCFQQALGGHALCAVGYNDKSPYFKNDGHIKCKGSWGDSYGDKGYHYISYRNITKNMMDAFSMVDDTDMTPYQIMTLAELPRRDSSWA